MNYKEFSAHIFWDCNVNDLDTEKNKKFIIQRVLDYGLLKDWLIIQKYYGIQEIGKIATTINELDEKSISFVSMIAKIPQEQFLCYITKQSHNLHWNF